MSFSAEEPREPALSVHTAVWKRIQGAATPEEKQEAMRDARATGAINTLNNQEQRELVFTLAQSYAEAMKDNVVDAFHGAIEVNDLLLPHERDYETPDIVDTYMSLVPELYRRYPEATAELTNLLDQNAHVVLPDVYLATLAQILRQPGMPSRAREGALSGLSYHASLGLLPFLEERLATADRMSVEDGATLLTLLEATASYGQHWSFSKASSERLDAMLERFSRTTRSALLRRKAATLVPSKNELVRRYAPVGVRAWINYYPEYFFVGEEEAAAMTDDAIMDVWRQALDRPDVRRAVRENDTEVSLMNDEKRYGLDHIGIEGICREQVALIPVADGFLGVYGPRGNLLRVLPGTDTRTYTADQLVHPERLSFLFVTDAMTKEDRDRRLQAQRDYVMFLDKELLDGIEEDFGFSVRSLTVREQMWFMASLRDMTPEDEKRMEAFTQTYGLDGAQAFLSVEFGDEMRETVLKIGETFPFKITREVFRRFAEIVRFAQIRAEELAETFYVKTRDPQWNQPAVEAELLGRARDLLTRVARMNPKDAVAEVEKGLERYRADTLLFASIFRSAYKGTETKVDFTEIRGLDFRRLASDELSPPDKEQMMRISAANWSEIPAMLPFIQQGL
jgi:hypothetical protein